MLLLILLLKYIFIKVKFHSGLCNTVWYMSHYVPHAVDHLLIIIYFHPTLGMGISTSQSFLLKNVMPVSMLQTIKELLHCTMLVCEFGTFIWQCVFLKINIINFSFEVACLVSVVSVHVNQTQIPYFVLISNCLFMAHRIKEG